MGIEGLWRWADSVETDSHISVFKGKKLAVDFMGWLHRMGYGCGTRIVKEKNIRNIVTRLSQRITEIAAFDVRLLLVLDGGDMPLKAHTDGERRARREKSLQEAFIAFEAGRLSSRRPTDIGQPKVRGRHRLHS